MLKRLLTVAGGVLSIVASSAEPSRPPLLDEAQRSSVRVHIEAHDDLDPDALRGFARPNVTLWLSTTSNTLRDSTLENLERFDAAFVELRVPLSKSDAQAFDKVPRAGILSSVENAGPLRQRLSARHPMAVRHRGRVDEHIIQSLRDARVAFSFWEPGQDGAMFDVLQWSYWRQAPGTRVLKWTTPIEVAPFCQALQRASALELPVAHVMAAQGEVPRCGHLLRIRIEARAEPVEVQNLVKRFPNAELVIGVGADAHTSAQVRALLEALGRPNFR
jgi:hypothetical protein